MRTTTRDLDVFIANGDVRANDLDVRASSPTTSRISSCETTAATRSRTSRSASGEAITRASVSRGAAFGDVDLDGDVDILVTNDNGPAELLLNVAPKAGNSAFIEILSPDGAPALGAQVRATLSNGRHITQHRAH